MGTRKRLCTLAAEKPEYRTSANRRSEQQELCILGKEHSDQGEQSQFLRNNATNESRKAVFGHAVGRWIEVCITLA
jgi:hypothetical protein